MSPRPVTIALTGGPCAGKTASVAALPAALAPFGRRVVVVPELATRLFASGITPADYRGVRSPLLRSTMVSLRRGEEDAYLFLASFLASPSIVLFDRAIPDVSAYCEVEGEYSFALSRIGLSPAAVFARYDLVLHLDTVALLNPALYDRPANPSRQEDATAAIASNERTWAAWSSHPNRVRVAPSPSFPARFSAVLDAVSGFLQSQPR